MSPTKKGIFGGAAGAAAVETEGQPVADAAGVRTVLPSGCSVEGKLICAGPTRIDGDVTGELVADDVLLVDANSTIVANLDVRELVVRGAVRGDVNANARVALEETAVVEGDIAAPSISISEGAQVAGKIEIRREATTFAPAKRSPAATPSPASRPEAIEADGEIGEDVG